jgi:hypothetical protein
MGIYSLNQEFNDWHWETLPAALKLSSQTVKARARGSCSFSVKNVNELEVQMPELDDLKSYLSAMMSLGVNEMLGELGGTVPDLGQLNTAAGQATQAIQAKLEPSFSEVGLQLTAIHVEAIENI